MKLLELRRASLLAVACGGALALQCDGGHSDDFDDGPEGGSDVGGDAGDTGASRGGSGGGGRAGASSRAGKGGSTGVAGAGGGARGGSGNVGGNGNAGRSGNAGRGGSSGGTGNTAGADDAGDAGLGNAGADAGCAELTCDANATCRESGTPTCECNSGFKGDGETCARYISCDELHAGEPDLPSGTYAIRPAAAGADFEVYCDMETSGGGWTLVLNEGTAFDPASTGDDEVCLTSNCVNRAYSTVPVVAGIMLDMKEGDIDDEELLARAIVTDVHSSSVDKTVREIFTDGPNFFESESNDNLELTVYAGGCEALPLAMQDVLCGTPVVTFADTIWGCPFPDVTHAVGIRESYGVEWNNCAGWPSQPNYGDNWFIDNFRVWVR